MDDIDAGAAQSPQASSDDPTPEPAIAVTADPAPAAAAPVKSAKHLSVEAEIEKWFIEFMHGSVVAESVHTFNHVRHATDELIKRLAAHL